MEANGGFGSTTAVRSRPANGGYRREAVAEAGFAQGQLSADSGRTGRHPKPFTKPVLRQVKAEWFASAGSGASIDEGDCYDRTFRIDIHHR